MPLGTPRMLRYTPCLLVCVQNNNNNTIWRGEESPPHSGELNHALSPVGGPTQSQLSSPMLSGHHISMKHRLRRKHLQLNSDTNAGNCEISQKGKNEKHEKEVTLKWTIPDSCPPRPNDRIFTEKIFTFTTGTFRSSRPKRKKKKEKIRNMTK